MDGLFWFSDKQWARIEPLLPQNIRGLKRVDDRRVLLAGRVGLVGLFWHVGIPFCSNILASPSGWQAGVMRVLRKLLLHRNVARDEHLLHAPWMYEF